MTVSVVTKRVRFQVPVRVQSNLLLTDRKLYLILTRRFSETACNDRGKVERDKSLKLRGITRRVFHCNLTTLHKDVYP